MNWERIETAGCEKRRRYEENGFREFACLERTEGFGDRSSFYSEINLSAVDRLKFRPRVDLGENGEREWSRRDGTTRVLRV